MLMSAPNGVGVRRGHATSGQAEVIGCAASVYRGVETNTRGELLPIPSFGDKRDDQPKRIYPQTLIS